MKVTLVSRLMKVTRQILYGRRKKGAESAKELRDIGNEDNALRDLMEYFVNASLRCTVQKTKANQVTPKSMFILFFLPYL